MDGFGGFLTVFVIFLLGKNKTIFREFSVWWEIGKYLLNFRYFRKNRGFGLKAVSKRPFFKKADFVFRGGVSQKRAS